jgi:hypothetical protein
VVQDVLFPNYGEVNSNFSVSNVSATKGTPLLSGNEIKWDISSLGSKTETFTYTLPRSSHYAGIRVY